MLAYLSLAYARRYDAAPARRRETLVPNLRERIRLTDEELREFLESAHTLQVASIGPDGRPHLVPMWFSVDDEGCIVFTTYRSSQKVRNIERDPRVTLLVEDGVVYDKLRGVMIEGEAELLDDVEVTRNVMRLIGVKYYSEGAGGDSARAGAQARPDRRRAVPKRIVVRIRPGKVSSWDHTKLLTD